MITHLSISISLRASNTLNPVAEAKSFEGVLNSKIKLLKNRLVYKNAIRSGIPQGKAISKISTETGYLIPQNLI